MKVLLLTHSVNPRGGVVHVLELGAALQARGHDVTLMAPASAGQRLFRETPCRVDLAPLHATTGDLAATVRARIDALRDHLRSRLAHDRFDVFHAHDGTGANALADLQAEGRIGGYLRTVHHVDRFADAQVQAWEERSIRSATRVLCVSALWRRKLHETAGIDAVQVPNGVDLHRFSPSPTGHDAAVARRFGLDDGRPMVLQVGGIEARKNTRRLLQAVIRLRAMRVRLVVAGGASVLDHGAEAAAFRQEARAAGLHLGIGGDVVVTGPLPDADMPSLYRCADVVAMPSLLEGFGLAALEGLASGAAVVVSRLAPFTEHFAEDDVHWADPFDPASIARGLQGAWHRGRQGVVPAVCASFGWARSAARHEEVYEALVCGARTSTGSVQSDIGGACGTSTSSVRTGGGCASVSFASSRPTMHTHLLAQPHPHPVRAVPVEAALPGSALPSSAFPG